MAIVRWDPFREMTEFNRVFNRMLGGRTEGFIPPIDLVDKGEEFLVQCDLPGVDPNDIEVDVDDNVLSIKGKRERTYKVGDGARFQRVEREYGEFQRSIALPQDIDTEHISAQCGNGVLEVHLPKSEQKQPRRIDVRQGAEERGQVSGQTEEESGGETAGTEAAGVESTEAQGEGSESATGTERAA
jgi:HSP20 family protein